MVAAYLLLLHQFRVWAIVDNIGAEDGRRQGAIDFLCVDMALFAIENEFVSLCTNVDCCFPAEKNEGEDIAMLGDKLAPRNLHSHCRITFSLHSAKNLIGSMP